MASTIVLPIGQSAIPASFKCAQAKGMPMMVTARAIAVIRCPTASHQPASSSQTRTLTCSLAEYFAVVEPRNGE